MSSNKVGDERKMFHFKIFKPSHHQQKNSHTSKTSN